MAGFDSKKLRNVPGLHPAILHVVFNQLGRLLHKTLLLVRRGGVFYTDINHFTSYTTRNLDLCQSAISRAWLHQKHRINRLRPVDNRIRIEIDSGRQNV